MAAQTAIMATQKQSKGAAVDFWAEPIVPTKQAVVWLKKAHAGSVNWVDSCNEDQFYYYVLLKKLKPLWSFAKCMLLVVMLFEKPAHCAGTKQNCATMNKDLYSWSIAILPLEASACICIVLYLILLGRMALRRLALGAIYVFHGSRTYVAAVGLICAIGGFWWPSLYTASFICRPLLFLGCTKSLRISTREVIRAVPYFLDVIVSLFLSVALFTCVSMVLFVGTTEARYGNGFNRFPVAAARMWVLFTTNNNPNVWLPAYADNKCYFFFFFAYLICMIYLLGNILLAKVYSAYKTMLTADLQQFQDNQHYSIKKAFEALAHGHTHITTATWNEFFIEYCDPSIGGIQVEDVKDTKYNAWRASIILTVFHGVDLDRTPGLNFEQFLTIMEVFFDRELYIPKKRPGIDKHSSALQTALYNSHKKGIEIGGIKLKWDRCVDFVILVGSVPTLMLGLWFCQDQAVPMTANSLYWVVLAFSVFYTLSLTAKIDGLGFERFWNHNSHALRHRFDFFNVYALIVTELVYMLFFRERVLEKLILLLAMARLLRLLNYIKPLQELFRLIIRLLPTYMSIVKMLMILYFIAFAIGRFFFGGMIYSTNPLLAGSPFAQQAMWAMNFNDCTSGLVTLFVLMIVNNFGTLAQAYSLVYGNWWPLVFIIGFFIVCNLVVLNILVALVLDCMTALSEMMAAGDADLDYDDDLEQKAANAGERSATYMLRKVLCADDHTDHADHPGPSGSESDEQKGKGGTKGGYGTFGALPSLGAAARPGLHGARSLDDLETHARAHEEAHLSPYHGARTMDELDTRHSLSGGP